VLKDNGMSPLSSTAAVLSRLNENKLATEVKYLLSTMTVVSWLASKLCNSDDIKAHTKQKQLIAEKNQQSL
jgi:hypothetical protein